MKTKYSVTQESLIVLNEADLVFAAQKGDFEAFNQLVLLYQDRIFVMALQVLGDEDSAKEIVQNIFKIAYISLSRLRKDSFRIWLYRIAINACFDKLHQRNKRSLFSSLDRGSETEERLLPFHVSRNSSILSENEYQRHELEQIVQQALDQLDARQRVVVTLVDLGDCNYHETAQILGISVRTVKSCLTRARLRLLHLLRTSNSIKHHI